MLVPFHQLHRNRDVWGADPSKVHPDRFLSNPKLLNSKSYRPFGGGSTLCPGRNLARRIIGFAVAGLVTRYEIHIDVEKTNKANGGRRGLKAPVFPRFNHSKPNPGASLPFGNDDVIFLLKERKDAISQAFL
ncbi:uncharacterized protein EI97DRAFT_401495 [Westerdykella ornata]|uniref:Cytochrome P450 n=1 Tax=Westerdykella ornata TaxID=318751 RepID=A0A6A6JER1_WESOR|nr:uncharacterized protein EI97DRAFT_401495 [Westerdykella ornata]KAF2274902.1 hypothetical protein EI97DRAFT_401495 [Westerdykella ornata]